MKLVDKDKIVAEIERRQKIHFNNGSTALPPKTKD